MNWNIGTRIEGITYHFTVKVTPQKKGFAEMMNVTLLEKARCMRLNIRIAQTTKLGLRHLIICFITNQSSFETIHFKVSNKVLIGKSVDY
jgi:hypothetical protein